MASRAWVTEAFVNKGRVSLMLEWDKYVESYLAGAERLNDPRQVVSRDKIIDELHGLSIEARLLADPTWQVTCAGPFTVDMGLTTSPGQLYGTGARRTVYTAKIVISEHIPNAEREVRELLAHVAELSISLGTEGC